MGQPILRSVDSECAGHAIEPRKDPTTWEPSSSRSAKAASRHRDARCLDPTGATEQGMYIWGDLRNLGGPAVSSLTPDRGHPDTIPWHTKRSARACGRDEYRAREEYCWPKATKGNRKHGGASERLHSTEEGGELVPEDPAEGRERSGSRDCWRDTWVRHRARRPCQRNSSK